ncbi:hypothetical protein AOLI_G00248110 [Acnodon oligacanthus]
MKKVMELICFVSCVMMPSERDTDLFIFHKTPRDTRKSVLGNKWAVPEGTSRPARVTQHPTLRWPPAIRLNIPGFYYTQRSAG